ncbi:MAG: M50 family metallopeptidase [Chloroflexi bacterium]|nr:M50 family metallopeptidase [Chloroflexota bacterium]
MLSRRVLGGASSNVRLFRLFGIDFTAHWSWLLLLASMLWVAHDVFSSMPRRDLQPWAWQLAVVATLLSVVSLYGHELAHALVARAHGIEVRKISLFLLGGATHITEEAPSPKAELLVAVAGPLTSLALGLVGLGLALFAETPAPALAALGLWLAVMNLPLAIFNLVPAYPLDGGRALRAMLWFAGQDPRWGSLVASRFGQATAGTLLLGGLYGLLSDPRAAISGVWLILMAWFMYAGAMGAHQAVLLRDTLGQLSVATIMQRNLGRVDVGATLRQFAELSSAAGQAAPHVFGVYRDNVLVGLVGLEDLRRLPAPLWDSATIERVMLLIQGSPSLEPGASATRALALLVDEGRNVVPVIAEERLLGVVTRVDLARATLGRPR